MFHHALSHYFIDFIQLISPTTSLERMKKIVRDSHEMIYYISMLSTTGGKLKVLPKTILKNYNKVKKINKSKNLVIGFGITSKNISSFRKICLTMLFFNGLWSNVAVIDISL